MVRLLTSPGVLGLGGLELGLFVIFMLLRVKRRPIYIDIYIDAAGSV
jgi:hypothetical protein